MAVEDAEMVSARSKAGRWVRRHARVVTISVFGVVLLAFAGLVWQSANGKDIVLTTAEARLVFAALLTYVPLVLIAVFVQARSQERADLIQVLTLATSIRSMAGRLVLREDEIKACEAELSRLRGIVVMVDVDAEPDIDELERELSSARAQHADLRTIQADHEERIASHFLRARSDARGYVVTAMSASYAVVFCLWGLIVPSAAVMWPVLIAALSLTMELVFVIVGPLVGALPSRDRMLMWLAYGIPFLMVGSVFVALAFRLTVDSSH